MKQELRYCTGKGIISGNGTPNVRAVVFLLQASVTTTSW